jgi:hypothetical protein
MTIRQSFGEIILHVTAPNKMPQVQPGRTDTSRGSIHPIGVSRLSIPLRLNGQWVISSMTFAMLSAYW